MYIYTESLHRVIKLYALRYSSVVRKNTKHCSSLKTGELLGFNYMYM